MADALFRFTYRPPGGTSDLDAYDASQALYGISRSLSVLTHYAINKKVIKQAPSLSGATVLIRPPRAGSFEFIVPIIQTISGPANIQAVAQSLSASLLYDLTKLIYRRLTGKSEKTSSDSLQDLLRHSHGDLDALTDSVSEDIVRIHRPMISHKDSVFSVNVYGGEVNIINLDHETHDFARTKILGDGEEKFFGYVTSFNGSTIQGRFWIQEEDRTVSFTRNKDTEISSAQRSLLAWSLNEWVTKREGFLYISGIPLMSKTGLLKHIF
jgi:hypothetical protein